MKLKRCNLHYEKIGSEIKCIESEIPFEVPEGWAWSRVGTIFSTITGNTPSTKEANLYGNDYPFFKPSDLDCGYSVIDATDYVSKKGCEVGRFLPEKSVLVTCIGATIGKTGLVWKSGICNQQINAILPNEYMLPEFVYYLFISDFEQTQIKANASATTLPILNKSKFDNLLILLPPYSEQLKIAEVISDRLSIVAAIESEKSDLLAIIAQVKSKILDLAIRGKLVPQDPDDEPASVLLECIRAEKEQLIKAGKIKRDKNESYIFRGDDKSYYQDKGGKRLCVEEMIPFDLPQQWLWCQLGEICDYGKCNNTDTATLSDDAWILDLEDIEKDTGKVLQRITVAERKSNSTKHAFYNGQLLYSKLRPYLNKVLIADDDGYCTSEILPLEFANIVFPPYVRHVLMSVYFLGYANQCSYGVKMPRLGTNDGKRAWIPLPPLPEQHRIVDAVDAAFAQLDTIADALA